jgi:ribosomal-protein-alanine N-acetyltransferase
MTSELRGQRSVIRGWRLADASVLAKHANNVNIAKHLRDRFPHPYTVSDARHFIEAVIDTRPVTNFAITVDGGPIGGIGFSAGSDVERFSAEIGYWLSEAFWGRGIVAEALELVTEYAFDQCNLLRLFALPFAENAQSIRVLEKAGYAREGILRASAVKYSTPRDQAVYSRINSRWKGTR